MVALRPAAAWLRDRLQSRVRVHRWSLGEERRADVAGGQRGRAGLRGKPADREHWAGVKGDL